MAGRYQQAIERKHDTVKFILREPERIRRVLRQVGKWATYDLSTKTRHSGLTVQDELMSSLVRSLSIGDTYFWSDEITKLVELAGKSLPYEYVFDMDSLPAPRGFCWLEYHIPLPDPPITDPSLGTYEYNLELAAVSWELASNDEASDDYLPFGILFTIWAKVLPKKGFVLKDNPNSLMPYMMTLMADGEDLRTTLGDDEEQRLNPDVPIAIRTFLAMLAFLDQQLLETAEAYTDRATRRRLERDPVSRKYANDPIQVITLRRPKRAKLYDEDEDRKHVEWSCRWLVRGHWRDQPYKTTGNVKTIWIAPYQKGPDDKPLRTPEKIFAVVR